MMRTYFYKIREMKLWIFFVLQGIMCLGLAVETIRMREANLDVRRGWS